MQLIDFKNDTLFYRADLRKHLKSSTVRSQLPPSTQTRSPESDAIRFYYCMSILNDMETHRGLDTELSQDDLFVLERLRDLVSPLSLSLVCYLVVICWGEVCSAAGLGGLPWLRSPPQPADP